MTCPFCNLLRIDIKGPVKLNQEPKVVLRTQPTHPWCAMSFLPAVESFQLTSTEYIQSTEERILEWCEVHM